MKPTGGRSITSRACYRCRRSRDVTAGIVFCSHRNILEGWINGVRIVITNASDREAALAVLRSVRAQLRGENPDDAIAFTMMLRWADHAEAECEWEDA